MIFVDRNKVHNPLDPSTKLGEAAIRETEKIARAIAEGGMGQRRLVFSVYKRQEVKAALEELFQGKCAYCESQISGSQPIDIEQFRPKSSVTESSDHPGYWWLANSWENLLASCVDCNRQRVQKTTKGEGRQTSGKGSRFPLADEKARVFDPSQDIKREQPLLLDPTIDDPADHLVFDEKGYVHSDTERGNTTIAVLGLNRHGLIAARNQTMRQFKTLERAALADEDNQEFVDAIAAMSRDEAPFAGMIRQQIGSDYSEQLVADGLRPISSKSKRVISKSRIKHARAESREYTTRMSDYSLESEEGIAKFKSQQRFIERVTIKNIRAIKTLDLDFGSQPHGPPPWMMLLGENGTGKSTVLQSLALVLSSHDQVKDLLTSGRLDPSTMVRYRCKSGSVSVRLSGFPKPHKLTVYRDRLEFESPHGQKMTMKLDGSERGTGWESQTLILGYGATRLLPRPDSPSAGERFSRVDNLFDAFVPLIDAQSWLLDLNRKTFKKTALVLKDLLALDDSAELLRQDGKVWVRTTGSKTALNDLSDGYQTILAVTVDMLEVLSRVWPDLSEAEGVVLIDELDAHLHPTWQMKIVGSLKAALPRVQYLTTTHQPLCLRGLIKGEVMVMHRNEDGLIEPLTDLPSPEDFRVDQLLTSDFFGLRSTVDPETEALFDTYYALLAIDERSPEEEIRLGNMREELSDRRLLGDTHRESLYYAAIDELLAKQDTPERHPPDDLKREVVTQVSTLWQQALRGAGAEE